MHHCRDKRTEKHTYSRPPPKRQANKADASLKEALLKLKAARDDAVANAGTAAAVERPTTCSATEEKEEASGEESSDNEEPDASDPISALFSSGAQARFKRPEPVQPKIVPAESFCETQPGKTTRGAEQQMPVVDDEATEAEKLERTVFVGNVLATTKPKQLKAFFAEVGPIESVRLRSMAVEGTKVDQAGNAAAMRKACFITGKLNAEASKTCNAYVVFRSVESAVKALEYNGKMLDGFHLRVDSATARGDRTVQDVRRSVFVGNIKFDASEEQLWRWFAARVPGGDEAVSGVRLIRSPETRVGLGIGFVAFKTPLAVLAALGLDGSDFNGRPLRVQRCKKRPPKSRQGREGRGGKRQAHRLSHMIVHAIGLVDLATDSRDTKVKGQVE